MVKFDEKNHLHCIKYDMVRLLGGLWIETLTVHFLKMTTPFNSSDNTTFLDIHVYTTVCEHKSQIQTHWMHAQLLQTRLN